MFYILIYGCYIFNSDIKKSILIKYWYICEHIYENFYKFFFDLKIIIIWIKYFFSICLIFLRYLYDCYSFTFNKKKLSFIFSEK